MTFVQFGIYYQDPETGFSHSSEGTWDEVKAHLEVQGWKEV